MPVLRWGHYGRQEAGCGGVISSVQMRASLCLRDAAPSQAKEERVCGERDYGHTIPKLCLCGR